MQTSRFISYRTEGGFAFTVYTGSMSISWFEKYFNGLYGYRLIFACELSQTATRHLVSYSAHDSFHHRFMGIEVKNADDVNSLWHILLKDYENPRILTIIPLDDDEPLVLDG